MRALEVHSLAQKALQVSMFNTRGLLGGMKENNNPLIWGGHFYKKQSDKYELVARPKHYQELPGISARQQGVQDPQLQFDSQRGQQLQSINSK